MGTAGELPKKESEIQQNNHKEETSTEKESKVEEKYPVGLANLGSSSLLSPSFSFFFPLFPFSQILSFFLWIRCREYLLHELHSSVFGEHERVEGGIERRGREGGGG